MKQSRNLMIWVVGLLLLTILGCDSTDMTSAKVYLQQKNYEKAEEMLLAATDKEPMNSEPSFLLATEIYSRTKNWDKVSEFLTKSASIDAKFADKIKNAREKYWVDNFNFGAKGYNALIKGEAKDEAELYVSKKRPFLIVSHYTLKNLKHIARLHKSTSSKKSLKRAKSIWFFP